METHYKKVSSHGTISIPVAVRRHLGIEPRDRLELTVEGGTISLQAYTPRCVFCGTAEDVTTLEGKGVCPACYEKLKEKEGWA